MASVPQSEGVELSNQLVRLYGRTLTHSSLSVVTAGFKSALENAGLLAGVYGVDTQHISAEEDLDRHAGAIAPHGVYTGPLDRVGEMFEGGRHAHYWVMVAPNSDRLPEGLVQRFKGYKEKYGEQLRFMAPSMWAAHQVARALGPSEAILSVPHGVSPDFIPQPEISALVRESYSEGEFRVLHFSTSAQQRKGTFELIQAWIRIGRLRPQLFTPKAQLVCILDYPAKIALQERLSDSGIALPSSVRLLSRADLPAGNQARVLASAHLVCQPSRGEAFGLVPLEALCVGTPVAATICTGHSEYMNQDPTAPTPGLVGIRTEADAPIDDVPGSHAPRLDPEAISIALKVAEMSWLYIQEQALGAAEELRKKWSWDNQLSCFMKEIRRLS